MSNKKIEELRNQYVASKEEIRIAKEQKLLRKMYECQEMMEHLLDKGREDPHYALMVELIDRLESHLQNNKTVI